MLTCAKSAVSDIFYSTVTLTFDPKMRNIHLCPTVHRVNLSYTLQDIELTMI